MDLKQLRSFLALVEEGSFAKAASKMNVAQSAFSTRIKALEDAVGTILFFRSSSGTRVTPSGAVLIDHAWAILERVELAKRDICTTATTPRAMRLGIPSGSGRLLTIPILKAIHSTLKGINVRITESLSGDLEERLSNNELDLSLLFKPGRRGHVSPETTEHLFLVAAKSPDDTSEAGPLTMEQLSNIDLTMPTQRHQIRRFLDHAAVRRKLSIRIVRELDSNARIMEMILNEAARSVMLQIAFFPEWQQNQVTVRAIKDIALERVVVVAPQLQSERRDDVEAVRQLVASVAQSISTSIASTIAR